MLYCSSDCGSISLDHAVTHNLLQHACTYIMYIQRSDSKQHDVLNALSHGAAQFPGNLQPNSTLKRCKLVTNVSYVKNILANCDGNVY